ncbi:polysaccharide biosynthesis tyrosine autokinase [Inquilinus sp. KBS0705]|nr:polysaccharide biosynthesis tyrosine autokinase [Inquilinus sp. KBS0705]
MEETEKGIKKLPNQEIDYFKIGKILISRWYWIAGSLAVFILGSYIYLWYTPKTYATAGTIKLEEKRAEITELVNVVSTSERGTSRIQSETSVIQSHGVILNAVKDINYPISFFIEGRVRTRELYPQKPLDIEQLQFDSLNFYRELITFKPINKSSFNLTYPEGGKEVSKNFVYNNPVTIGTTTFSIKYPQNSSQNTVYLFKFNSPEELAGRARGGLYIAETIKNSNILIVSETDANPVFASDVLNAIMKEYLVYDRNRKTQSATQMINFIDSQLKYLSTEVEGSEGSIQRFKQKNKLMDVGSSANGALEKAKDLESQQSILKLQLLAIDQLKQQIVKEKNNLTLNLDIGQGQIDPTLSGIITSLDNALSQRNDLLKTFTPNSQLVQDVNNTIIQLKSRAINNLNISITSINNNLKYLNSQISQLNQKIATFPVAERELISIQRDYGISEKVYSFLSEKKLEAQISRSGILPGATILEQSQPNYAPVSPNEHDIRRSAIIFGLAIGLGLIVLIRILNPYIYDKETIESLTTIPIIGVIRKFPDVVDEDNAQVLALSKPKSIFAESVRSVRTNLNFIASEKQSKVICITSEVAGEGKSFVAVNLSSTLSLIDKKVLLIGADLRRSKLHKTFKVPNDTGLSTYLSNQSTLDDVILKSSQDNLDFIISGPVPPNPSELLHSARMIDMINLLKLRYDVIMIDTAPIGLVSDAIPLIRMSDINIFVIRSGKSKFYSAIIPERIAQEYHLDNTVIVLNAYSEDLLHSRYYTTKFTGENYGTRYYYYSDYSGYESSGYYVDNDKKKWWSLKNWLK